MCWLLQAGEQLMADKPETREQISPILASLSTQWDQLETTTTEKADKLFENKRAVLYEQSCDDIDGWVTQLETQIIQAESAKDLTTVNLLMQNQNVSTCSFSCAPHVVACNPPLHIEIILWSDDDGHICGHLKSWIFKLNTQLLN